LGDMAVYTVVTAVFFVAMTLTRSLPLWGQLAANTLFILLFAILVIKRDFPLSSLPVIGKKFKKQ